MTVRQLYSDGHSIEITGEGYEPKGEFRRGGQLLVTQNERQLNVLLRIGSLCSDAQLTNKNGHSNIIGDPTEGALVVAATKAGMLKDDLQKEFPRIDEIPFESERMYMATLHSANGKKVAYVKGATEKLLLLSGYQLTKDGTIPLKDDDSRAIMAASADMAKDALRVIALAYVELPDNIEKLEEVSIKGDLVFVGLAVVFQ